MIEPATTRRAKPRLSDGVTFAVMALPYLWALISHSWPALGGDLVPPMLRGLYLALGWGTAVVFFGAGLLFGRVSARPDAPGLALLIAALPAVWTWIMVTDASDISVIHLIAALIALAAIDRIFTRAGLAPGGGMGHRLALTLLGGVTLARFLI